MSRLIFQLDTKPSFFENILTRPNGNLLLTRQDVNELWEVVSVTGSGKRLVTIPDVESLTGITEVSPDIYAVGAGIYRLANHEGTVPGSYSIWIIDLTSGEPQIRQAAKTPEIGQLNGIAAWDARTVLVADSHNGKIYCVDIVDGTSSVAFEDDTTRDAPGAPLQLSVNGIKVREVDGKKYIYYTNTTRMLFCRVLLDDNVKPVGAVEILGTGFIPSQYAIGTAFEALASDSSTATPWFMPDDFCFSRDGTAYVTSHPTNIVFKVVTDGAGSEVVKIAGGLKAWDVASATACTFGRSKGDGDVLYISTAGANVIPIDGQSEPAKVVAVEI